jgi:hypothetical protein
MSIAPYILFAIVFVAVLALYGMTYLRAPAEMRHVVAKAAICYSVVTALLIAFVVKSSVPELYVAFAWMAITILMGHVTMYVARPRKEASAG